MSDDSGGALAIDEVLRIAQLSHLGLRDEEKSAMARELGKILAFVEQLSELDLEGVPPTTQIGFEGERPFRSDEPGEEIPSDVALSQAPKASDGGFSVPAFVDEG